MLKRKLQTSKGSALFDKGKKDVEKKSETIAGVDDQVPGPSKFLVPLPPAPEFFKTASGKKIPISSKALLKGMAIVGNDLKDKASPDDPANGKKAKLELEEEDKMEELDMEELAEMARCVAEDDDWDGEGQEEEFVNEELSQSSKMIVETCDTIQDFKMQSQ